MSAGLLVHNHSPEEGEGLRCPERPIGACMVKALRECLEDHVGYYDCKHPTLDECCCTCEAKRLLGRGP